MPPERGGNDRAQETDSDRPHEKLKHRKAFGSVLAGLQEKFESWNEPGEAEREGASPSPPALTSMTVISSGDKGLER